MVDNRDIQKHLLKMGKMLRRNKQNSDYYDFCYRNMKEYDCKKLKHSEKSMVMRIINKVRQDGYPNFPAVKDCFFNAILISLFSLTLANRADSIAYFTARISPFLIHIE